MNACTNSRTLLLYYCANKSQQTTDQKKFKHMHKSIYTDHYDPPDMYQDLLGQ